MNQLSNNEFLEYIDQIRKLRRPKYTEINTEETDLITGFRLIHSTAWLLMIKNFKPDELTLRDMTEFLASLEHEANEYLKTCSDKEICEQFPEYVRMLKVIYHELLERGVKTLVV